MKSYCSGLSLSLLIAGSLAFSQANAITSPSTVATFADAAPQTLTIHPSGWSDPAFGDMGWTHRSAWGTFTAEKGQMVVIKAASNNPDIHPGMSVWYRGAADTIADNYVYDHFYAQMANQFKSKAKDETTGVELGNLVMKNVAYGYDLDGKSKKIPALHGIKNGTVGELSLKFKAPHTGTYMFVLGGINPGASLFSTGADGTLTLLPEYTKMPVDTSVTVSNP